MGLAGYKRPHLILHDLKSLLTVAERCGGMQIVLAGKAHPNDRIGFEFVKEILDRIDELENHKDLIRVIMLENFDTFWGKLLSTSVDIWLNNPLPPFEASGTSGMKAILNGVPQLTTLDGWVVEAAHQDIGRTFGYSPKGGEIGNEGDWKMDDDAKALYQTLEEMGTLYRDSAAKGPGDQKNAWVTMMIHCVAQAHHFNTHRMLKDYQSNIWKF
jgi:glycogen phosphorylase